MLGEDVTAAFVRRIAAKLVRFDEGASPIIASFDTRFQSGYLAREAAGVLAHFGSDVKLVEAATATPVVSWATRQFGCKWGLQITASHNPPEYSGIKMRTARGSSPPPDVLASIEQMEVEDPPKLGFESGNGFDATSPYVEHLRGAFSSEALARRFRRVVVDSMHGASAGLLAAVVPDVDVVGVRQSHDPLFGGTAPEPKESTIGPLRDAVAATGVELGFAHDGDGDRVVAWENRLGYVSPHDLAVVMAWLLGSEGRPGAFVASATTTRRMRRLAEHFGREFIETDVGFHHASAVMNEREVAIAAEENGGLAFGEHVPDRDGTYSAAALLFHLAAAETSIGDVLAHAEKVVGASRYQRTDIPVKSGAVADLEAFVPDHGGGPTELLVLAKGTKAVYPDGSWLVLRRAGTEPLLRIYVEADSKLQAESLTEAARRRVCR